MNIGNNIKWGTVRIDNNRIPGTDNYPPTMVEGTLNIIYMCGGDTTNHPSHYLP